MEFNNSDCPFTCEFPIGFDHITHGKSFYGYSVTAINLESAVNGEVFVDYSFSREAAVDRYLDEYLDAISQGTDIPAESPFRAQPTMRIVFPLKTPLIIDGAHECFHIAGELDTPSGVTLHEVFCRCFLNGGRVDIRLSALTTAETMAQQWESVIRSFHLK